MSVNDKKEMAKMAKKKKKKKRPGLSAKALFTGQCMNKNVLAKSSLNS